jgi:peptidyl-tRNA hydrolase
MKMYIAVRESVPVGFALVATAHASLATYLKFKDAPEVQEWIAGPFYKVVCKVSDAEFEKAKEVADSVVITESALGDAEVALGFMPRQKWPTWFRFLKLYR